MAVKPPAQRILALDYGLARIGVALSDERQIIATPLKVIKASHKLEETVTHVVKTLQDHASQGHYHIAEIVVGLPLMMTGKSGFLADEVRLFAEKLGQVFTCPIVLWDERLTSVQADRSIREGQFSRKRRAQMVDTISALIILQSYLDHKAIQRE